MNLAAKKSSSIQFGKFILNLETRELSFNGTRWSLQEQPFQTLIALLERPGQLVTRDELKNRLWPSDTFVDFDQGLNKAVNRLREALEDSSGQSRFIETLHRRGYRWIGPLPASSSLQSTTLGSSQSPFAVRLRSPMALGVIVATLLLTTSLFFKWVASKNQRSAPPLSVQSLAVLPLDDLSPNRSQDYFADGMTEQLITELGQINELRVISRNSTMQYKGTHKTVREIARELGVDAIVEGSVLRSGEKIRITAQLIHSSSDRHLWAQSYQGDVHDVLGLQNQVASEMALQIKKKLIRATPEAVRQSRVVNPQAHDLFLRGLSQPTTTDGLQQKLQYFEQAVRLQPDYAEAYAEMGQTYVRLGHMLALPPREAFLKAELAGNKVLEVDPSLYQGHLIVGAVNFLYHWDFVAADKEIQRAIELAPNSVLAHHWYVDFLMAMGRSDEALDDLRRQRETDPIDLTSKWQMAAVMYASRNYDDAIAQARNVLSKDPNNWPAHLWLGLALEQKRDFKPAIQELKKAAELSNIKTWAAFVAHAQALAGNRVEARKVLRELQLQAAHTYVSPWWSAMIYTGLGEKRQALVWLEKAYAEREHDLAFSNAWPIFDSLRLEPEYQALTLRVGLIPQSTKQ